MAFENARNWFYWFIRKMRNDPMDMFPAVFIIALVSLAGWVIVFSIHDSLHSQRAQCTKFEASIYVDPKTGEERPSSSEEFCVEWISPVTGKPTTRKKD